MVPSYPHLLYRHSNVVPKINMYLQKINGKNSGLLIWSISRCLNGDLNAHDLRTEERTNVFVTAGLNHVFTFLCCIFLCVQKKQTITRLCTTQYCTYRCHILPRNGIFLSVSCDFISQMLLNILIFTCII